MRMNISVPDDLKARMDRIKETVNWSALACRAFEQKVGEVAAAKKEKNMQDVVDRLRATNRDGQDEIEREGREAGVEWARDHATASELRRLADDQESEGSALFGRGLPDAYSLAEHLVFTIRPKTFKNRKAAEEFWDQVLGDDAATLTADDAFVLGFAAGALNLWAKVEGKVSNR